MKNRFFKAQIFKKLGLIPSAPSWKVLAFGGLIAFVFTHCNIDAKEETAEHQSATEIALAWNHLALDLERHTLGYRPPVSARMFAYVEIAGYESALPGLKDYISLEKICEGYKKPLEAFEEGQFYLPASINASFASIFRHFFPTAPQAFQEQINQLEQKYQQSCVGKASPSVLEQSAGYGKTVANTVWEWAKTDREGHEAHLYNYAHGYEPPICKGCWQPTGEHPSPALLPFWGKVRTFYVAPSELTLKPPVVYDEAPGSAFYTEAMEVYSVSKPLSKENLWIAEFWSDDLPGLTCTPSGRWISIANQAIEKAHIPFPLVIETYLKTALALSDASISVWKGKYEYNVERPETYIDHQINPNWKALHETPSFPAYPSGHAAFGAAAAEVLSDALGKNFELTDRTHEKRPEFASRPRSYKSFAEMAQENAASRVFLGVHYRMDCEEGLRVGKLVGQKIANLELLRKEAAVLKR